jgi:hypothetical protein
MNARTTEVCWDPTLVRVEYLDEAGIPYYCCINACEHRPAAGTPPNAGDQANTRQREQSDSSVAGLVVVLVINVIMKNGGEGKHVPRPQPGPGVPRMDNGCNWSESASVTD